jgi:hypothetical protein
MGKGGIRIDVALVEAHGRAVTSEELIGEGTRLVGFGRFEDLRYERFELLLAPRLNVELEDPRYFTICCHTFLLFQSSVEVVNPGRVVVKHLATYLVGHMGQVVGDRRPGILGSAAWARRAHLNG